MVTPDTNRRAGEHDTCDRAGEHDTCDGDGMKAKALFCEASITCANNTCMHTCLRGIIVIVAWCQSSLPYRYLIIGCFWYILCRIFSRCNCGLLRPAVDRLLLAAARSSLIFQHKKRKQR